MPAGSDSPARGTGPSGSGVISGGFIRVPDSPSRNSGISTGAVRGPPSPSPQSRLAYNSRLDGPPRPRRRSWLAEWLDPRSLLYASASSLAFLVASAVVLDGLEGMQGPVHGAVMPAHWRTRSLIRFLVPVFALLWVFLGVWWVVGWVQGGGVRDLFYRLKWRLTAPPRRRVDRVISDLPENMSRRSSLVSLPSLS